MRTNNESRGLSRVDVAGKKLFRSKIVTTKEGLETTNNDLTFIPYCEFPREGFARDWLLLGLFQLIVLRTLQPCSAKSLAGGWGGEIISCRNFFFFTPIRKNSILDFTVV